MYSISSQSVELLLWIIIIITFAVVDRQRSISTSCNVMRQRIPPAAESCFWVILMDVLVKALTDVG
jgi:hypothetical protein